MPTTDPLHDLQAAARRYARHVLPGAACRRVILFDDHKQKVCDVLLPACAGSDEPLVPEVKPGWDFSRTVPRFDGAECAIHGRPLAVLRMLAEADGPVSVEDLRAAWDGYQAGDSTIRSMVGELRKKMQKLFPMWEGDVLPSTGAGYELGIR